MRGVVRRLAASDQRDVFVLRGGLVTARYCAPHPRAVADVDFLAELPFDRDDLEQRLAAVLDARVDDGLTYDAPRTEVIWEETEFPGLRVQLQVAGEGLQIDIGCGDPMHGGPIDVEIVEGATVRVCRPETMLAWKVHGLFERSGGRWRAKDLHDIDLLIRFADLDDQLIAPSIELAFASRGDELSLARRLLSGEMGGSRSSRRTWRTFRNSLPDGVEPGDLPEVIDRVSTFLRGIISL